MIASLLRCDFERVPTEVLLHRFMFLFRSTQHSLHPYIQCLRENDLSIPNCRIHINTTCLERFGSDPHVHTHCRTHLWDNRAQYWIPKLERNIRKQTSFDRYQLCMERQRQTLNSKCLPRLREVCEASPLRVTKTVRLNMDAAVLLLDRVENLRFLHLIRDPRAVALSRRSQLTYRGIYGDTPEKEALLYCRGVVTDLQKRPHVLEKHPGTIKELIYEEFAHNPQAKLEEIYEFLKEEIPEQVRRWFIENTDSRQKNSTHIAERWMSKMTYENVVKINRNCRQLYEMVKYSWD